MFNVLIVITDFVNSEKSLLNLYLCLKDVLIVKLKSYTNYSIIFSLHSFEAHCGQVGNTISEKHKGAGFISRAVLAEI